MTENESIKQAIRCVVGACDETCPHYWSDGVCHGYEEVAKGLEKALEEIQQYKAIGTVEELEWCKDASHWKELFKEKLEKYEAIGTIEEFKDLKEKNEREKPLFVPTDDTCLYQEYRCPSCNEWLADKFKPYRCKCGQKLDWQ